MQRASCTSHHFQQNAGVLLAASPLLGQPPAPPRTEVQEHPQKSQFPLLLSRTLSSQRRCETPLETPPPPLFQTPSGLGSHCPSPPPQHLPMVPARCWRPRGDRGADRQTDRRTNRRDGTEGGQRGRPAFKGGSTGPPPRHRPQQQQQQRRWRGGAGGPGAAGGGDTMPHDTIGHDRTR